MQLAPQTVPHIVALIKTGAYNSNHFFRVDKGFVAQVADVRSGRMVPLTAQQATYAAATVPLEVTAGTSHVPGTLSMARHDDPNSGGSSFSVLLGNAPHLDMKYTIFGCGPISHSPSSLCTHPADEMQQVVATIKASEPSREHESLLSMLTYCSFLVTLLFFSSPTSETVR